MTSHAMDGEHSANASKAWATVWVMGELSSLATFEKVSTFLAGNVKDPDAAKVFQGTANGEPAVYVVFRQ